MIRNVMIVAAVLAALALPADADPKCWLCAGSTNGATCLDNSIPNFSMTRCGTTCFYYISTVCFCRTYGDMCIEPAPAQGPVADEAADLVAMTESRFTLEEGTLQSLREQAGELVAGFLSWPIPKDLRGPGPHRIEGMLSVDSDTFPFSGEITFMYRTAVIRYEINDHSELSSIVAQFGPNGFGGTVFVDRTDGKRVMYDF